ncbi:MAG: BtpA/SgcQ family protein [Planctomycetes bacterium]|nr:BtpA/SgcQ family protein [Planctomycetota bacterium]
MSKNPNRVRGAAGRKLLLGVVHLQALPSAARHRSMTEVLERALADGHALAAGGVDGLVVENFGDAPFRRGDAEDPNTPDVPAALAVVGDRLRAATGLPIAINCLRNDGVAALGAAAACGARWIRVNVLTGACVTDQGLIAGEAARLFAYRRQLHSSVEVLADFLVKHAAPLAPVAIADAAKDLAERSGAAGLVLSGSRTGAPVDVALLDTVRQAVGRFPIWIGSGLTPQNAAQLWPRCDGAIVGTACKRGGCVDAPVDPDRVRALRQACE